MWDRVQLKERAKLVLGKDLFGKKWLTSALATLLNTLVTTAAAGLAMLPAIIVYVIVFFSMTGVVSLGSMYSEYYNTASFGSFLVMTLLYSILLIVMFAIVFVVNVFVTAPLNIGFNRYFLALRDPYDNEPPSVGLVFSCFKKGRYMQAVKGWGVTLLLIQLWLLIPYVGSIIYIIKYYEYFYVPFIMADNPDIDRKFATAVSSQMTSGEKGKIFVMQLSFLGWELLGSLIVVLNIPVMLMWVTPYIQASYANLYDFAKRRAIGTGLYRPEVYGIYPEGDPEDPYAQPFDINAFYTRNRNYSRGCY